MRSHSSNYRPGQTRAATPQPPLHLLYPTRLRLVHGLNGVGQSEFVIFVCLDLLEVRHLVAHARCGVRYAGCRQVYVVCVCVCVCDGKGAGETLRCDVVRLFKAALQVDTCT